MGTGLLDFWISGFFGLAELEFFYGETGVAHVAAGVDQGDEFCGVFIERPAGNLVTMFHERVEITE